MRTKATLPIAFYGPTSPPSGSSNPGLVTLLVRTVTRGDSTRVPG